MLDSQQKKKQKRGEGNFSNVNFMFLFLSLRYPYYRPFLLLFETSWLMLVHRYYDI
jgi:hypothetical protein